MSDRVREEFEAWAKDHAVYGDIDEDGGERLRLETQGGCYLWTETQAAWEGWKASRASLVIELPPSLDGDLNDYGAGYVNGSMQMRENCIDAIEAAGVKVK